MPDRGKTAPKIEEPQVEQTSEVVLEEPKTKPSKPKTKKPKVVKEEQKLNPHVKVVIHSTDWCQYCPALIKEAEKLKDEYEIVVEEHSGGFRTAYGSYINSFPYVEYYYDGKIKLYSYGYRTAEQLKKTIESLK